jgi:hypothetical protein
MTSIPGPRINWLLWIARLLALLWGGFWIWYGVASGISEGVGVIGTLRYAAMPGLILLASALFAWKYARTGGFLLIIEGLIIAITYPLIFGSRFPLMTVLLVLLTMATPPILAGLMFLIHHKRHVNFRD